MFRQSLSAEELITFILNQNTDEIKKINQIKNISNDQKHRILTECLNIIKNELAIDESFRIHLSHLVIKLVHQERSPSILEKMICEYDKCFLQAAGFHDDSMTKSLKILIKREPKEYKLKLGGMYKKEVYKDKDEAKQLKCLLALSEVLDLWDEKHKKNYLHDVERKLKKANELHSDTVYHWYENLPDQQKQHFAPLLDPILNKRENKYKL